MLSIISRHYDLDRVRGSVLTASTLFQIELGGNSIKDLRDFVNRIRLVLSAIPIGQRPDDRLTGEWLFHRVKHIRKLERVIEDIRESGSTSYRREWSYLWDKIQDLIVQDREDSNAQSVLKSLQSAAPAPKTKAVPAIDGGNGKTKAPPPAAPKTKAAPTRVDPPPTPIAPGAPAPNATKPKAKAKAKAKAMTDAEKAKTPCIFFQMPSGCTHGDNCKFSHKAAAPKPKAKAKDGAKSKPGAMTKAVVALVAASSLCNPVVSAGPTYAVEWAADTAAGRHLGSAKALFDQGIPRDAFDRYLGASKSPVTFHTGGGPQSGVQTLGFLSNNMDFANHYMLDSCPLVRSTGIDVDPGKAFVWLPGILPFFVSDVSQLIVHCPESCRQYATRVDEHVPIFTSEVRFTHGAANPVGDPSGGSFVEDPAAVPSAIQNSDSHPAEVRAKQVLSSGGNISCRAVRNLFNLVDKEPAARGDHGDSFSTGLYRMGGALGLRTSAHRFPLVTKAFNKFAQSRVPGFGYTTLCIFSNITTGPHRDFHNADQDNAVISLGGFTGGCVWVEESGGTTPCPGDPSKLGKVLNFKNGVIRLRAKRVTHATMPWRGDRVVMVLFSAKHPSEVKEAHCEELRALGFPIDSCVDPLPAFAAKAPEGPAADAPPDGAGALDDDERSGELLHGNDSEDKVPGRVIKLRDQAMSLEHRLFHFPKNPFCDICNQARMLSRRVRRKPRDSEVEPDPLEASEFGEVIAADHIHVFRSPDDSDASDKSYVVLCLRDKYTGLFAAFPGNDRSTNAVVVALRKFVGRRVCSKPVTLVSDAADEFEAAAEEMGWISSSSLPNRFPHNAQLEREIRSFQEGVRSSFLEAGFSIRPELWPVACRFGAMAMNLTLRSPQDESRSRWDFNNDDAGREESHVRKLLLGQLVFYRHKHESKFGPNAAPGLFAGWRLEPGGIYRDVTLVLDLEILRTKTGAWTDPISVPESELYVRSGAPVLPLRNAAEHALLTFANEGEVAPHEPLPIPFTPHVFTDQGERKKLRRIYITYARFRKIGPTPGCSACENDKSNHNAECIARFEKAFGRESKAPETPVPKDFLSYEDLMLPRPPSRDEGDHLSDYEPSEIGGEEAPAAPAIFRHQKSGALVLFEIVSHSGSHLSKNC